MNEQFRHPFSSITFWRAYIVTMRPYLLFVSGAAGLVGLAFIEEPQTFRVILGFIPLFLSYGFGQALTDCFQMDTDAISAPYRPLVKGEISPLHVGAVSLAGLIASALLLAYLNPWILILGVLSIAGLAAYTFFKRTWWGGPPWNSWIVALLPIMGRMVDRDYRLGTFVDFTSAQSLAFFLSVLAVFFGYANFVVAGYFKDISADKKTGYRTFHVVFGWSAAAVYSDSAAIMTAALTFSVLIFWGTVSLWALGIFVIAVAVNLWAQIALHRIRDERKTNVPIANVVRAFVLYCLAIVVSLKLSWIVFAVAFYVLFEVMLRLRPEKSQV